ncbi:BREX system serine/threonine kinase PglW [Catellatospora sp. NPDC049111]|uniref:BREX system serine/threonine kinase PglW n=1 Tax=Catellatospora sp. NPDC049111 TaxID=3155271 RepID=UPI0033D6A222
MSGVGAIREDSPRWEQINPSGFLHEREGLRELASYLPDADPFHVWANVEFVGTDGTINEVDALVLTENGLYVLELKHWQGEVSGDGTQWVRRVGNGRLEPWDNPYVLANRKAKRLSSLMQHYAKQQDRKASVPFVRAAVFLHARNMRSRLDEVGRQSVYGLDGQGSGLPSLKQLLLGRPRDVRDLVDPARGREIVDLVRGAKIRPSVADRKLGSLLLHPRPLAEGVGWQDFLGGHTADTAIVRRVRFYLTSRAEADEVPVILRAADREFRLLQGMRHDGIAAALDLVDHPWGPAVVFEHDENWVRLDHWLTQRGDKLTLAQRLTLVQDLAEIVEYAHARRLVHRSLHPKTIFVKDPDRSRPQLVVTDWQTGGRLASATQLTRHGSSSDPAGLELFYDDEARRYQAPEAFVRSDAPGSALDVFSLGVIAYRVFAGAAPAATGEELLMLVRAGGLNLAGGVDGVPATLVDLVYDATRGDPAARIPSVARFRAGVEAVWDELTAPEPVQRLDPLEAKKGDELDGELVVIRPLGSGATAKALLVRAGDSKRELVLKVAKDERHGERLRQEGRVLAGLNHWQVAALVDGDLTVGGRTALLLESAGEQTLAQDLERGPLALDLLERYGRDLLDILAFLDAQGVAHRDLKPANLAARPRPKDKQLHLCVFDFSLAATPVDQLLAGTPGYLDPFLGPPRRQRYDPAAEWFAAAVTLYEMATGKLPRWGDGANPVVVRDEVTLDPSVFPDRIADRLVAFFAKALARDAPARFDTVEKMTDAWRVIFKDIPEAGTSAVDVPLAANLTRESPIDGLGLTDRARSALNRLGVHSVSELLDYEPSALTRAKGVPDATRKEILAQARALRTIMQPVAPAAEDEQHVARGIESVAATLLPDPTSRNRAERDALAVLLGQTPEAAGSYLRWPAQSEAARGTGQSQPQLSIWLRKSAPQWLANPALTAVRDEVVALLDTRGAVLSAAELAEALIADRGSYSPEPQRTAQAIGVVRAAVEAELSRGGDARVAIRRLRGSDSVLVGREPDDPDATITADDLLKYAIELGMRATELAAAQPLPTRQRTAEELRQIVPPGGMPVLSEARLVQLAVAASNDRAAVNAAGQLYPVGMPAAQAVRLSAGSLIGQFSQEKLRSRVSSRFPRAEALPDRPALDDLLRECGVLLRWDATQRVYGPPTQNSFTATRILTTVPVAGGPGAESAVDARLAETVDRNGFLVVLASFRRVRDARERLLSRYPLAEVDVTAILLATLRASGAPWELIVSADAQEPRSPDFQALRGLVQHDVLRAVEAAVDAASGPVLITEASPLARYDEMGLLRKLADTSRTRPAARLLLTPYRRPEQPLLDDVPLPLISRESQALHLPDSWLDRTAAAERAARP